MLAHVDGKRLECKQQEVCAMPGKVGATRAKSKHEWFMLRMGQCLCDCARVATNMPESRLQS